MVRTFEYLICTPDRSKFLKATGSALSHARSEWQHGSFACVDGTSWCKYCSDRQPFKNFFFSLVNFCDVNDSYTGREVV